MLSCRPTSDGMEGERKTEGDEKGEEKEEKEGKEKGGGDRAYDPP